MTKEYRGNLLSQKNLGIEDTEIFPEDEKALLYGDLNRVWTCNGYFYKPSSLLWRSELDGVIHELKPKNKHGSYPYYQRSRDHTWGNVSQLTQEEALWLTLEFNPELMNYV
ncbi:hypothetical protein [Streptococcus agalactiae]|uniref:hypothetical protein n=1 Tax=Streptococcus agalactiae TaxID=1311 RepID=UPI000317277B|nr:hypothetical protein [Streptococcus agalactiae]